MKPRADRAASRVGLLVAASGLACLTASCRTAAFSAGLPAGLPDVTGWEKSSGSAELSNPRRSVDYELFVHPDRPAVYSIIRYRIRLLTPGATVPQSDRNEKLQWDRGGADVRRYMCEPGQGAPSESCRWRELARGSAEYDIEMPQIISIYWLHARLLREREAGRLR